MRIIKKMHEKAFQADLDTIDLRKKPHTNAWNGIIKSADTVHRLLSSQKIHCKCRWCLTSLKSLMATQDSQISDRSIRTCLPNGSTKVRSVSNKFIGTMHQLHNKHSQAIECGSFSDATKLEYFFNDEAVSSNLRTPKAFLATTLYYFQNYTWYPET